MVDYFAFTDALAAVPAPVGTRHPASAADLVPRADGAPARPRPRPAPQPGTRVDA